jgi:hypothetical protein
MKGNIRIRSPRARRPRSSWSGRMDVALAVSSLPSAATKGALTRNRGPTLTDRRAAEEAAAMEKEKEKMKGGLSSTDERVRDHVTEVTQALWKSSE